LYAKTLKEWKQNREDAKERIKKFLFSDEDRIKMITQIGFMHGALADSVLGLSDWVTRWVSIELNKKIAYKDEHELVFELSDKELQYLHNNLKDFTIKYIDVDMALANIMDKKIKKYKQKKSEEKRSKENDRKMIS